MLNKFQDLKIRLSIYSIVIFIVGLLIYTSVFTLSKLIIGLVVVLVILSANFEFYHLLKAKAINISIYPSLPFIFLWPSLLLVQVQGFYILNYLLLLSFVMLLVYFLHEFRHIENCINRIGLHVLSQFYLTVPLSLVLGVLFLDSFGHIGDGRIWFSYLICVTKASDVGGYFFGNLFGKTPLAPEISPKKTIEGAYGGLIFSVLTSLAFFLLSLNLPKGLFYIGLVESLLLGFLMGIISQLGDLSESLIKRDAKIKNSSTIPAVGGVLDVVDSLIFAIPFLFFYLITTR
jgi:phosphatidate cytidylyltransferase